MASHTQLVYGVEEEANFQESNTENTTEIILNHLVKDVHSIQPIYEEEERNTLYIMRYLSSILEEDTSSSRIISPDIRRINLLAKNLDHLPEKEVWHLFIKLYQNGKEMLDNIIRKYISDNQLDPDLLERYSKYRNLLWSLVIGTGCQFSQTKGNTSKKRFNKLRQILSPTEGTSHFFCLPMAERCHLIHLNFVAGSRDFIVNDVTVYEDFVKDTDVLPDDLKHSYQTFNVELGESVTMNWIEWLTYMSSSKKESRFLHTLCMITFHHLVTYFIELGFERGDELQKLLQLPFYMSVDDWVNIFSPFAFGEENHSTLPNFSYFIECFGKWKKNHQAKANTKNISTNWHDLIKSSLAFVQHSTQLKKKKNHLIWTDAASLFGQSEIDNWKLKKGFPLPIDCCHIKFSDVTSETFCWSSIESHFVAMVFMALDCLKGDDMVNVEVVFQREIDTMKKVYSISDKKEMKEMNKEIYDTDPMKAASAMHVMKELHVDQERIKKKLNLPPAFEEAESMISLKTVVGKQKRATYSDERQTEFENSLKIIKDMFDKQASIDNIVRIAREHCTQFNTKYPLPPKLYCDSAVANIDDIDNVSSIIYPDDAPTNLLPQSVYGDGNCLFRSFSLLCFGNQEHHIEMRCRAILELLCNPDFYLSAGMLLNDRGKKSTIGIISTICVRHEMQEKDVREGFADSIHQSTILGRWNTVSFWHVAALSSVCKRRVRSIYPAKQVNIAYKSKLRQLLNRIILPRDEASNQTNGGEQKGVYIMWTHTHVTDQNKLWTPNHFVPCLQERLEDETEEFDECGIPKSTNQMEEQAENEDAVELLSDEEEDFEDGQKMTETPCNNEEIYFGGTLETFEIGTNMAGSEENVIQDEDVYVGEEEDNNINRETFDQTKYGGRTQMPHTLINPTQEDEKEDKVYVVEEEEDNVNDEAFDEAQYGGSTQIPRLLMNPTLEDKGLESQNIPDLTYECNRDSFDEMDLNNGELNTPHTSFDSKDNALDKSFPPATKIETSPQSNVLFTPSKVKRTLLALKNDLEKEKSDDENDEQNNTFISHSQWLRDRKRQKEAEETCDEQSVNSDLSEDDGEEIVAGNYIPPDNTFLEQNESQDRTLCGNAQQQTFDYTPESLSEDDEMDETLSQSLLNETIHFSPIPKRKHSDDEEEDVRPNLTKNKKKSTFMHSTPKKPQKRLSYEASVRKQLYKKAKTSSELSTKQERTAKFVESSTPSIETVEAMRQNNELLLRSIQEEKDKNLQITNELILLKKDNKLLQLSKEKVFEEKEKDKRERTKALKELVAEHREYQSETKTILQQMKDEMKVMKEKETSVSKKFRDMSKNLRDLQEKRETEQAGWTHQLDEERQEKTKLKSTLEETIQQMTEMKQQTEAMMSQIKQEYDIKLNENLSLIKDNENAQMMYQQQVQALEEEKKSFISQLAKCVDQSNQQSKLIEEKDHLINHLQLNTSVENNQLIELMDTKHTNETTIQTLEMEKRSLAQALQEKEFELQDKIKLAQRQIALSNDEFVEEIAQLKNELTAQLEKERNVFRKKEETTRSKMEARLEEMNEMVEEEKQLTSKTERELSQLKRHMSENETILKEKNEEVKKLKDDLRQLKIETVQLEKTKDDLYATKLSLNFVEKDKKDAEESIANKDRLIKDLERKVTQLTNDNKDEDLNLREQLSKANNQKEKFLKDLEKTKHDLQLLKGKTESNSDSIMIENNTLKGKIKLQEKDVAQLRAQLKETTQDMQVHKNSLNPLIDQNDTLKTENHHLVYELDKQSKHISQLEETLKLRPRRRIITKTGSTQTDVSKKSDVCEEKLDVKDLVNKEVDKVVEEFNKRLGKDYFKGTGSKYEKELGDVAEMLHSHWNFFIRSIEDFRNKKEIDDKFAIYVKSVLGDITSIMKSMQLREENISTTDDLKRQLNDLFKQLEKKDAEHTFTKRTLYTSETENVKLSNLVDEKDEKMRNLSKENELLNDEMDHVKTEMHKLKDESSEKDREFKKKMSSMEAECKRLEWQIETTKKRMHGLDEKIVEKDNHIAKLEWTANQKQKKFFLLKDQVTTLSNLGRSDDISSNSMDLSGKWKWMRKALVNFC